jgi:hypothetical protein
MQHALHVSALALKGHVVTDEHIQPEVTAACAGSAVCLYYVTGTCKAKTLKCGRLHRRVLIKSAASSGADVCMFYLSDTGCRNGTSCTFRHFVLPRPSAEAPTSRRRRQPKSPDAQPHPDRTHRGQ